MSWSAAQVIETYTGRWNLETAFQELRCPLGLESPRGWTEQTVLRVAPCLFGLDTVVAALDVQVPARRRLGVSRRWAGKEDVTFADALTAVRRWLGVEWVVAIPGQTTAFAKLSRPFQQLLLAGLTPAA